MTQQKPNREQRRHPSRAAEQLPSQIQVSYINRTVSPVLHADGVFGGLTPHGLLYMAFFSEHAKIPDSAQLAVDKVARKIRPVPQPDTEWVREVGTEIIMGLDLARSFRKWLDDKIKLIEQNEPANTFTVVEEQQPS
ncbi:MAG: hypothetical protein HYY00_06665 [Chloroflexi bacterium]|nr:hypothetical protein [Chloroflexota bacterium]